MLSFPAVTYEGNHSGVPTSHPMWLWSPSVKKIKSHSSNYGNSSPKDAFVVRDVLVFPVLCVIAPRGEILQEVIKLFTWYAGLDYNFQRKEAQHPSKVIQTD